VVIEIKPPIARIIPPRVIVIIRIVIGTWIIIFPPQVDLLA
jgi:hypothetical protein